VRIHRASSKEDIEIARELFREYADWLRADLCFQKFAEELAGLPGEYAPPRGRLLIACEGSEPIGCAALRPRQNNECEMKRLYVRPAFQGRGFGRRLAEEVIAQARAIGYSAIVLDTLPSMGIALRLYEALGFTRRSAYYATPLPETIFMELKL